MAGLGLVSEVISGGCPRGVDALGERWAAENGIKCVVMRADWGRFGRAAGMMRNSELVEACDCAFILWDRESRGTLDTIDKMRRSGKPYYLLMIKLTCTGLT